MTSTISRFPKLLIYIPLLLLSLIFSSRRSAALPRLPQADNYTVRAIETDDPGVSHPGGLAFSPAANTFLVLNAGQNSRARMTNLSADAIIYVSSTSGGNVGGVSFQDEDVLAYDTGTGLWSMFFDGSDVGLSVSGQEVDAFHLNPDGSLLLSLGAPDTLPDVGSVDDFDIVRFIPTSLGDNTAGSYELYFDGEDVELTTSGEDIDGLSMTPDGKLLIGTRGSFSAGGISGGDEDLYLFTATSLGATTSGTWALYFDGSDVGLDDGLNDEDVTGAWLDANGDIYLTTRGPFAVPGASGDSADILVCVPASTGENTSCTFNLFWDGSANGFAGEAINALFLSGGQPSPPTATNTPSATATGTSLPTATDTSTLTATDIPTPTTTGTAFPTATATDTPSPTTTSTSLPTATNTSTPTATDTPSPTATDTSGPSLNFTPVADTFIQFDAPDANTGSDSSLQVDGRPVKQILLKFVVSGVNGQPVSSAVLRLYVVDGSKLGGEFHTVPDNSWQEGTVTWNTAPAYDPAVLASLGSVSAGVWYDVDLTSLITGDGTYSLLVFPLSNNGADYSSKEGVNPPQLIVNVASTSTATHTPSPTVTTTNTPTPTATNTPTSTSTDTPLPTATHTPSPSPTDTLAPTPTAIATSTPTATNTITQTATSTPTFTATNTPTPTATNTFPPTATDTPTLTPTQTTGPSPTASATPGPGDIQFAVIGDYGSNSSAEAQVATLVASWNPDFILTTGDNNYPNGEASTIDENIGQYYSQYIGNYQGNYGTGSVTNRFWPSLGNHDWVSISCSLSECNGPYFDYFALPNNERYYEVDFGLVHLFAIDSDSGEPDGRSETSVQADWLQNALAASTSCYNLVILHHSPFSSGQHGSDSTMQWPYQVWGADAVFSGHDHLYERLDQNGFPYFVNGAGGATLYQFSNLGNLPPDVTSLVRYNDTHGAMLVHATTTSIIYRFYNEFGDLIDEYSASENCSPLPTPTATPTDIPTPTTTSTPTPTTTNAPTPTSSSIATSTPTATYTPTPTTTATDTPTPTATNTTTSGPPLNFTPVADAFIEFNNPDTNTGSATTLEVDASPLKHFLLKFVVSGVNGQPVSSAILRLYNVNGSNFGGEFHAVPDNSWLEGTVTWNTAPAYDPAVLASLGSVSAGVWYDVDLTSLITGDGTYSLMITPLSGNGADYSSKEGANPPQLIVNVASSTPTSTPTPTPTDIATININQYSYRIRTEDSAGLNADSGWAGALNENVSLWPDTEFRIRFEVEVTGGATNKVFELWYSRDGGAWAVVPNNASPHAINSIDGQKTIQAVPSVQYTDLDTTTNLLAGSSTMFVPGTGNHDNTTPLVTFSDPSHVELEWTIIIRKLYDDKGHNPDGTTFDFRLREAGGLELDTYTNTPRVTVLNKPGHIGGTVIETPMRYFVVDNAGNLYYLCEYSDTSNTAVMMKSTNGGISWNPVGITGAAADGDLEATDMDLRGDTIYITIQGPGFAQTVRHYRFNVSTHPTNPDEWALIDEEVAAAPIPANQNTAIVQRSSTTVIAYRGDPISSHEQIYYRIRSGGSWGPELQLDSEPGMDFNGVGMVRDSTDKIHFVYTASDGINGYVYMRTLSTDDSLGSRQTIHSEAGLQSNSDKVYITPPFVWNDGGTERVGVGFRKESNILFFISWNASTEVLDSEESVSEYTVLASAGGSQTTVADLVPDNSTGDLYALYGEKITDDLFHDIRPMGGAWGTDAEEHDNVNVDWIRAQVFTHNAGARVLGYIWDDGSAGGVGKTRYDEKVLAEAPMSALTATNTLTPTPTATSTLLQPQRIWSGQWVYR